jgi:hypothetical protein
MPVLAFMADLDEGAIEAANSSPDCKWIRRDNHSIGVQSRTQWLPQETPGLDLRREHECLSSSNKASPFSVFLISHL